MNHSQRIIQDIIYQPNMMVAGNNEKHKNSSIETPIPDPLFTNGLDVDIVLGMPSRNCQYLGICKISKANSSRFGRCNQNRTNRAKLYFDKDANLVICFELQNMTEEVRIKHFNTSFFTVIESIHLPKFIVKKLGYPLSIRPGDYKIHKTQTNYLVIFTAFDQ